LLSRTAKRKAAFVKTFSLTILTPVLVLFVSAFSIPAHSQEVFVTPVRVGNNAKYVQEMITGSTAKVMSRQTQEVISYNESKKLFTVRLTITPVSGTPTVETQEANAEELASQDELLKNCTQLGGVFESLVVDSKKVTTCKIEAGDPDTDRPMLLWFGSVPFALVRSEVTVSPTQKIVTRLETFSFGQ
jgi:hypothetical protein